MSKLQKVRDILMASAFLVGINVPVLGAIFKVDPVPSYGRLAPLPDKPNSLKALARSASSYKDYYNDRFGFRGSLIFLHAKLKHDIFGISPSNSVLIGKDGWLFLKSENVLDDWRRLYPFDDAELDAWQTMLEARQQFLAELGIPYVFVVAPNKHTIYGDRLPDNLQQISDRPSRLDRLIERLEATNSPVKVVDLRPSLQAASQDHLTYHRTDTHWNLLGAYVGYAQIAGELNEAGVSVDVPALDRELNIASEESLGGDLSRLMGLKQELTEERVTVQSFAACQLSHEDGAPLEIEDIDIPGDKGTVALCPEANNEKIVFFHDSFGKSLYPYLGSQFKRSKFVWSDDFDPEVIRAEMPDIVIQEIVERKLLNGAPDPEELAGEMPATIARQH